MHESCHGNRSRAIWEETQNCCTYVRVLILYFERGANCAGSGCVKLKKLKMIKVSLRAIKILTDS